MNKKCLGTCDKEIVITPNGIVTICNSCKREKSKNNG